MSRYLHVAVGVVKDPRGRVLLARRPDHVHQGGLWEFPGGKVEAGESLQAALRRELREELAIEAESLRPLIQIRHHYEDKSVLLDVWEVLGFQGSPRGNEGQPLAWVEPADLQCGSDRVYQLPAANEAILKALQLPDLLMVTGDFQDEADFLARLERALRDGVRLVQVRDPGGLRLRNWGQLLQEAASTSRAHGARLVLNSGLGLSAEHFDGLHLRGPDLMACRSRPVPPDQLLGASCHSRKELEHATEIGADYALLSPVASTASHPQVAPLGWEGFRQMVEQVNLPVYALGGMEREDLSRARAMGGQGIAAIRALWKG